MPSPSPLPPPHWSAVADISLDYLFIKGQLKLTAGSFTWPALNPILTQCYFSLINDHDRIAMGTAVNPVFLPPTLNQIKSCIQ